MSQVPNDVLPQEVVFDMCDTDANGSLTADELRVFMAHQGMKISMAEAIEMIKDADADNNGEITFDEYLAYQVSFNPIKISKIWKFSGSRCKIFECSRIKDSFGFIQKIF